MGLRSGLCAPVKVGKLVLYGADFVHRGTVTLKQEKAQTQTVDIAAGLALMSDAFFFKIELHPTAFSFLSLRLSGPNHAKRESH